MSAGLNFAQQEAVNYMHGPCLVLAGAGSGKTRVITHKVARLIQAGLEAKRIAAITFTNKAAAEMRERAKSLIGREARDVLICTFHALGVRMLRQDGEALGLKPRFSILDSDDVTSILKDAGGSTDAATARQWQWAISLWKNMGLNAAQAEAQAKDDNERITARIMARYEERLAAYQSVDFDDLIGLPLKLLQQHAQVREKWQAQLGHVLVDEYQDTNATQYEVLKLLVGERARFTAVGDDDQSIYGWRGATLDNLKRLPLDFPQLKVVKLEQNYRSTSAILRAANNVIGPNPKLFPKTLFSELGEGEPVRIVDADNEEHEAERVVARIQSTRANGLAPGAGRTSRCCTAPTTRPRCSSRPCARRRFRTRCRAARAISTAPRSRTCAPGSACGSTTTTTRLSCAPSPRPSAASATRRLQNLGTFASRYKLSLFEALFSSSLGSVLPAKAVGSLHEFGRYVNDLEFRARHTHGAQDARAFMLEWLKDIDYEKHLYDGEDSEKVAASRWTNVLDFCDWMSQRCGGEIDDAAGVSIAGEKKSLLEVAQTIALLSTISEREQDQDVVTLSTLHAAKGLEWPHVMLVGVTEGLLPFKLGDDDNPTGRADGPMSEGILQRLQEERRLMYVGITRAQRSLAVSWTKKRKKGREMIAAQPSRFIAEMALEKATTREDPREKLKALRAEFAKKAVDTAAAVAAANAP